MNSRTRLGSMLLDHIIMVFVVMIFYIPSMGYLFPSLSLDPQDGPWVPVQNRPSFYVCLFGIALYFCKDSFNGRSLAKRILKIQIVDDTSGRPASSLQCVLRNVFCILWPIEVLVILANPERRLGDLLAGTRVVYYEPGDAMQEKTGFKKVALAIIFAYAIILLGVLAFKLLGEWNRGGQ